VSITISATRVKDRNTVESGPVVTARAYEFASPPLTATADAGPLSLGTEFYVTTTGIVTQIHFWQATSGADASARTVGIYTVSTGTLVQATETLTVAGAGWQTKTLAIPVPVTANVRYKAVVYHPVGAYASTSAYYSTGPGGVDLFTGALTVPSQGNATSPGQSTYNYASNISYPTSMFGSSNYWIDLTVATPAGSPLPERWGGFWPGPTNTGVPSGTVLTPFP
jgi:hypothetical protein